MGRPKKSDPELLLVSFCDILTISISGLFMATIITVFEATKIPELKMTPRAIPTHKSAVFFECRGNQVFFVDKDDLDVKVAKRLSTVNPGAGTRSGDPSFFLKAIAGEAITNEAYAVNPKFLLVGVMALDAKEGATGISLREIDTSGSRFESILTRLDSANRYIAFLVRDDSFPVFRHARRVADDLGFDTGWELLGVDEPIKFGASGTAISVQ